MCRQGGRTMPDPCMMEDKPEVRANPGFGQQIPANPSFEQPHQRSTLQCRDPHPGQAAVPRLGGLWGGDDQMHSHPSSSTQPSPQAGDLGFAGRCSGNSLNHSSNYISAFASGRRDVGPCTSPRHQ